jgi:hypothetical protein
LGALAVVVQLWGERNNSLELGEADTLQALRENKVRSMCRCLGAQPERWLVPSKFWNDREFLLASDGTEAVDAPGRFFCWQPDLERMLSGKTKSPQSARSTAEGQARQGAP